ncbi:MAG: radical SAM family heme chaperone HemW [Planctomycetes bacterium]|nr:radical SAM family heme chaperone HemW [Planctomycetota bacterium]
MHSRHTREVQAPTPRAAYVHVPFCRHRCGYCNFTVVAGRDDLIEAYLDAIEREMASLGEPAAVETLFLGGGTPTHLSGPQLRRLLSAVRRWFPPRGDCEWSVEANPGDIDETKADVLAEFGVTRISLGAQSFDSEKLRRLERDHEDEHIRRAVAICRPRFASLSLDLIFGAPGETLEGWRRDLTAALELQPDHLSTYGLTYELGTTFWGRRLRGELASVEEDAERAMYESAIDTLTSAGLEHYEVSNFARPGHRCRHNEVYWSGGRYWAVGPGAARYVGDTRSANHRSTFTWRRRIEAGQSPVAESETLSPEEQAREKLVLGLRRIEGVSLREFQRDTAHSAEELAGEAIERFLEWRLLARAGDRLLLTRDGLLVSDSLWPELLQGASAAGR